MGLKSYSTDSPFVNRKSLSDRTKLRFNTPKKTQEWLQSRQKTDYTYSRSCSYSEEQVRRSARLKHRSPEYPLPIMSRTLLGHEGGGGDASSPRVLVTSVSTTRHLRRELRGAQFQSAAFSQRYDESEADGSYLAQQHGSALQGGMAADSFSASSRARAGSAAPGSPQVRGYRSEVEGLVGADLDCMVTRSGGKYGGGSRLLKRRGAERRYDAGSDHHLVAHSTHNSYLDVADASYATNHATAAADASYTAVDTSYAATHAAAGAQTSAAYRNTTSTTLHYLYGLDSDEESAANTSSPNASNSFFSTGMYKAEGEKYLQVNGSEDVSSVVSQSSQQSLFQQIIVVFYSFLSVTQITRLSQTLYSSFWQLGQFLYQLIIANFLWDVWILTSTRSAFRSFLAGKSLGYIATTTLASSEETMAIRRKRQKKETEEEGVIGFCICFGFLILALPLIYYLLLTGYTALTGQPSPLPLFYMPGYNDIERMQLFASRYDRREGSSSYWGGGGDGGAGQQEQKAAGSPTGEAIGAGDELTLPPAAVPATSCDGLGEAQVVALVHQILEPHLASQQTHLSLLTQQLREVQAQVGQVRTEVATGAADAQSLAGTVRDLEEGSLAAAGALRVTTEELGSALSGLSARVASLERAVADMGFSELRSQLEAARLDSARLEPALGALSAREGALRELTLGLQAEVSSLGSQFSLWQKEFATKCCDNRAAAATATGITVDGISQKIKSVVDSALRLYSADKTGLVDYALESAGGSIISTRCSETYRSKTALLSIFGIPLWYEMNSPRTVIQPDVHPGNCWAFRGTYGYLVIKLAGMVEPTAFSLEHIPRELSPTGIIDSAPKNFSVYGLVDEKVKEGVLLGSYVYEKDGNPLQMFPIQNSDTGAFPAVELRVKDNWGNLSYTCIYRFRVHGNLHKG